MKHTIPILYYLTWNSFANIFILRQSKECSYSKNKILLQIKCQNIKLIN
jgi:hypothetical protein